MVVPCKAPAPPGGGRTGVGCHTGPGDPAGEAPPSPGAGHGEGTHSWPITRTVRPSWRTSAPIGIFGGCDPTSITQRGMVEHLGSAPEQLGEDVAIDVELVLPLGQGEPVHRLVQPLPDGGPLLLALIDRQAGPAGLLQQILHVQGPEERREEMGLQLRELKPSVVRGGRYQERERLMGVRLAAVVEGGNLCERIGVPLRQ